MAESMSNEQIGRAVRELKIGIVGGLGNIGWATARGLVGKNVVTQNNLIISGGTRQHTINKAQEKGIDIGSIVIAEDNKHLINSSDVIIIALKQPAMQKELKFWKEANILDKNKLIVSFVAGIRIDTIKKWIGNDNQPVIRVMPNTPVAVGRGVFGWATSGEVSMNQANIIRHILGSLGTECWVQTDEDVDKITSVSGSGPALVLDFINDVINHTIEMGFSSDTARKLAIETFIGTAKLLEETGSTPDELIKMVKSRGGTTEKALESFAQDGLQQIVSKGMQAARDRAKEIGDYYNSL